MRLTDAQAVIDAATTSALEPAHSDLRATPAAQRFAAPLPARAALGKSPAFVAIAAISAVAAVIAAALLAHGRSASATAASTPAAMASPAPLNTAVVDEIQIRA